MKKITIIGMGNMGTAIAERFGEAGFQVISCRKEDDVNEKLGDADMFVIAVKPQSFKDLASSVSVELSDKLAISAMAGVTIASVQKQLHMRNVVRAMPNLGVKIGKGVVGWVASPEVEDAQKKDVHSLFQTCGSSVEMESEEKVDAITALHNPSYYFYICEQVEEKAKAMGFSPSDARQIAEDAFVGSAAVFASDDRTAAEWRAAVTSKGGTTEASINHFEESALGQILQDGIEKGKDRSEEISQSM